MFPLRRTSSTSGAPDERLRPILRTATAMLSIQGLTWLTSLVSVLVVPRFLGTSRYGTLATAGTLVALGSLVAAFGASNHLIKGVAREPSRARDLVFHTLVLRLGIWSILAAAGIGGMFLFTETTSTRVVFAAIVLGAGVGLAMETMLAALHGNQTLAKASFFNAVIGILGQVSLIAVLILGGGIVGAALVGTVAAAITFVAVSFTFRSTIKGSFRPSRATLASVAAGGATFLAWDLGLKLYGAADYVILAALTDTATVGEYAFAYRLVGIPIFAATIVTASVYPALSASRGKDDLWFSQVLTNGARIATITTLPMACGLAILAPDITRFFSGNEFEGSGLLLAVLAIHIPAAAVHTVLGAGLFAMDRQRYLAKVAWVAAALNISANALLVPLAHSLWANGALASAGITVATELFMGVFIWRALWNTLHLRSLVSAALRAGLATAVMAAAALAGVEVMGLPGAIAAGALTYLIAGAALGVVTPGEVRMLTNRGRTVPATS